MLSSSSKERESFCFFSHLSLLPFLSRGREQQRTARPQLESGGAEQNSRRSQPPGTLLSRGSAKKLGPNRVRPPPPARGLARLWFPSGRRLPLEVSFRALCTSTHLAGGGELRRVGARWVASFFLFFSQQACLFEGEGKKARPRQIAFLAPCTPFSLFISISLLRFGVQGADQGDERRKLRNSEARGSSAEDF